MLLFIAEGDVSQKLPCSPSRIPVAYRYVVNTPAQVLYQHTCSTSGGIYKQFVYHIISLSLYLVRNSVINTQQVLKKNKHTYSLQYIYSIHVYIYYIICTEQI